MIFLPELQLQKYLICVTFRAKFAEFSILRSDSSVGGARNLAEKFERTAWTKLNNARTR